jgi:hypothetical protein
MSKVKFVSPSGKVITLGEKALQSTSLRTMGYRPYDEVYAPVAPVAAKEVTKTIEKPVEQDEQPKRGRPRVKTTVSDADQA